jgi:uncharacterized protein YndB with AHSA1/START domain
MVDWNGEKKMKKALQVTAISVFSLVAAHFAQAETRTSRDIEMTIELPVSVERAWELWTENQSLQAWLAPRANVNLTLGGSFELFWDLEHPDQNSTLGCKVLSLVRNRLLAFEWRGPVEFSDLMNTEPFPTWVSINFENKSETSTVLHFRHSGWQEGERWEAARTWQSKAWQTAFTTLKNMTGVQHSVQ